MTNPADPLLAALAPLVARVRTDVTARKGESGRQAWTREPLTAERLARHLNGGPARGVSQIKAGESVTMVGVLDLDSHGGEVPWGEMARVARDVMLSLELLGGAPVAWRSSGGRGIHLYCLWERAQDAYSVRRWLSVALESCGLRSGAGGGGKGQVEVFPKQDSVPEDGFGNQVVLPLAGLSVPLVWCDLADTLVPGTREDALAVRWEMSDPVPLLDRPVRAAREVSEHSHTPELAELRGVLNAVPNGRDGVGELDYDSWLAVVFAIHHETGGSDEGLALAHEVSGRSHKYDAAFLDERIWPYVRSDRAAVRGLGTLKRIASAWGWHEPLDDGVWGDVSAADDAPPLPPVARVEAHESEPVHETGGYLSTYPAGSSGVGPGVAPAPPAKGVKRRGIPEAQHLTTDQANANRLVAAFGRQVLVAAGRWHVWDGKRWAADESDVYRFACRLSGIIKDEAHEVRARGAAQPDPVEAQKAAAIADALLKWAQKSEMKAGIEAAIGLARKMLTVDEGLLDRDPMLLNVENGILDLRTGKLRRHDPDELLTKLVPVRYVEGAQCPTWDRFVLQITREEERAAEGRSTPIADYLRRWFGYCLTGMVNEQAFVVHWGSGSNGKSTLLAMMAETMGDYACTAPPGLVAAGKGERHPTEIASLMGRRMVTAHESGEGVVLREDFIKQATGEDVLSARFMRGDFFDFRPTHKLQLLTNHKPQIKGQDAGIWRRVQLMAYMGSWGTEEEVREGKRERVKDIGLLDKLRAEAEGILAWRVKGALEWAAGGLNPPAAVRAASDAYKSEQDRVGQFIGECCETGPGGRAGDAGAGFEVALTDGMGGLYPAYVSWCKDGGVWAVSKLRFLDDVLRVVDGAVAVDRKSSGADGRRRKLKIIRGLRLLPE